ncbi:MAG TPA: prepilin-type N-terminal cleavage/methylation domain-containing protein [Opitutaceae bacterium]|nr:prepilin-type N-terminal cleavage/methylation domain-containing protein [Opitutaceae bacterium]
MKRSARAAFTLLEILLAIALIGVISAALVAGSVSLLRSKPTTPDEIFWQTVHQARKAALEGGNEVRLSWDNEHKAFAVDEGTGAPRSVPIPDADRDLEVDFVPADSSDMALIGGNLASLQHLPFVSFYPDGTCSPFQVQVRDKGSAHLTAVDPWTCAQMLKAPPATP